MQAKVFGIGISRTGTTSLTYALRILGYRAVHCPLSILSFNGNSLALSRAVVEQFDAFTDTPVARLYRELDAQFPGSKFVLTIRPIDRWLLSMRRMRKPFLVLKLLPKVRRLIRDFSGTSSLSDETALKDGFVKHSKNVLDYFGERLGKDLLVLDVSAVDAWDKLCGFLGHQKPAVRFPHYNRGYGTTIRNMGELIRYAWPII